MTIFSEKLARLPKTISSVANCDLASLAEALRAGRSRLAIAIGSGGSVVAAEFFKRCRTTLGFGHTLVMTPMQFVLCMDEWAGCEVWLFSAGADNPDISAAFKSASDSRAEIIQLVTVRNDGSTTMAARDFARAGTYVLPVADPKDGFLATHSMAAMVTGLLLASDLLGERPSGRALSDLFLKEATAALQDAGVAGRAVEGFKPGDTVVLLHDPQVAAVAALIETSLWETGIAPVQRTDFRNFAHGRHVWAARHPSTMFTLALTTFESNGVWTPIAKALPAEIRTATVDFGNAGRLRNAVGIVQGLSMIEAVGRTSGIDPGRPGRGAFAEAIYDNTALDVLAGELTNAIRHKAAAQLLHDPVEAVDASICSFGRDRLRKMAETCFVGVALDYDGTIVATETRLDPPAQAVLDELVRLVDGGVQVGIATGRGGSAGEMLREVLPERVHPMITMGYYNGAHVRALEVDIEHDQPAQNAAVLEVADWIERAGLLRDGRQVGRAKVQLSIKHADITDVENFGQQIRGCPAIGEGRARVLSSHHSFDVVAAGTSKLRLVEAITEKAGRPGGPVLSIGDSGSPLGNDHELLSGPYGVSVDSVCGSLQGCWSLFGSRLMGPAALVQVLRAMCPHPGGATIDFNALGVDGPA